MQTDFQQLIESYKPSPETVKLVRETSIVLIVGVSGAGKDTMRRELLKSGNYHGIVTHTTRQPRMNGDVMEQDGVDYHFITKVQAAEMLRRGEFIEANLYSGNIYGSSVAEIQRAHDEGKTALADIEVQGVAAYKAIAESVIAEFILPPNYTEWQRRLRTRYAEGGADSADLAKRMKTAVTELQEALNKPYYHYVVNENLDEAVKAADSIARHNDEFTQIDRSYRAWAERLLEELQKGM